MEKIREYSGNGKFIFKLDENVEISSNFSLLFFSNGRIELYCYLDMFSENATKIVNENNKRLIEVNLEGDTESPKGKNKHPEIVH
jgi:hypothetical protein